MEAEIANDPPKNADKLNTELGFSAPKGSISHEKGEVIGAPQSDTAYASSDTPDDEEPTEAEKQTLRRGKSQYLA